MDGELVPLWFKGQQFPDKLMKPEKRKAPITQMPHVTPLTPPPQPLWPQQFSGLVAKYTLQDGIEQDDDCFASNKRGEYDTDTSDNDSDSGDSDDEVYI